MSLNSDLIAGQKRYADEYYTDSKKSKYSTPQELITAKKEMLQQKIAQDMESISAMHKVITPNAPGVKHLKAALHATKHDLQHAQQDLEKLAIKDLDIRKMNTEQSNLSAKIAILQKTIQQSNQTITSLQTEMNTISDIIQNNNKTLEEDKIYKEYLILENKKLQDDLSTAKSKYNTTKKEEADLNSKKDHALSWQIKNDELQTHLQILNAKISSIHGNAPNDRTQKESISKDISLTKLQISRHKKTETSWSDEDEIILSSKNPFTSYIALTTQIKIYGESVSDLYKKHTLDDGDIARIHRTINEDSLKFQDIKQKFDYATKNLSTTQKELISTTTKSQEIQQQLNALIQELEKENIIVDLSDITSPEVTDSDIALLTDSSHVSDSDYSSI